MITKEESRDYKLGVWNYQIHTASAAAVTSVVSDSVQPHSRQPIRIPHPWESPGKNTEVSCHFLLQCIKVKSESEVAQSCPTSRPRGLQPTRLLHPWDFPGKSTGVGCRCLLHLVGLAWCQMVRLLCIIKHRIAFRETK